ncbi:unnamed protein product [Parajaminaea phylloscopi]
MSDHIEIPPLAQATAGATGSIVSNTIVYPLDLVSTRVQTSRTKGAAPSSFKALYDIFRNKGVRGLYQGLGTDNLSSALSNFLFFFFRAAIAERLHQRKLSQASPSSRTPSTTLTPGEDLAVGALAGVFSRAFTTPLSNVTVRKQTYSSSSKKQTSGKGKEREKATAIADGQEADSSDDEETAYEEEPTLREVVQEIIKDKGVIGLWSGFETAILLSITPALTFGLTNIFTRLLVPRRSRESPSPAQIFITSALGNATSTTLLYPLIIAKTLLQYRDANGKRVYQSLADVLLKVAQRKGVQGLYQGLESQLTKGVIAHGVTMMVKSRVEDLMVAFFVAMKRRQAATRGGKLA